MRRLAARLLPGLTLGALFLWLSLRHVEFGRVLETVRSVDPGLLALACIVGPVANLLRAWRWRRLLPAPPATGPLFAALMIGTLANNALPARLGELVRLEAVKRRNGLPRGAGLASIVVEKVLDGLTLCLLLGVLAFVLDLPRWAIWLGRSGAAVFLAASLLVLLCLRYGDALLRFAARQGRRFGSASHRPIGFLRSAIDGLAALRRPSDLLAATVLSFAVWGVEALMVWLVFEAAGLDLSPPAAPLLLTVLGLGMMLPSPPGFIGTYEYFGSRTLGILAVAPATALAVILLLHLQVLLISSVIGLACLATSGLALGGLAAAADEEGAATRRGLDNQDDKPR